MEHELLLFNSDSWTDAQQPNPCTPTVIQGFAEHGSVPTDDPIEDISEVDMATGSMASAGRSPNKHPRTGSEEDNMDFAALMDRAADRFSAKLESMMDRLEKRFDEKIDSKFGPVMDRLSVLEKTSSSTRSGPSHCLTKVVLLDRAVPLALSCSICSLFGNQGVVRISRQKHTWTDRVTKLRLGIGPDLDSLMARVGALRVRNTKIMCYLKIPSLCSCKQIREAMNPFIEKENIKLGPQGTTPFVIEEKPAWRQEQQRTCGKALGVAEQLAPMKAKYITSEWYPFYQVDVHESESTPPIHLLTTTSGVPVATMEGAELLGITADKLVMACRRCTLSDEAEELARLKFAR